jgi:hypothetical protein
MELNASWEANSCFWAFYWTRTFISAFTRACPWSLFWARWIQSITAHPISLWSILLLSPHLRLFLPDSIFSFNFFLLEFCVAFCPHCTVTKLLIRERYYVLFLIPVFIVQVMKLVQFTKYNTFSKIPPSTSMHFPSRVRTWRVARLHSVLYTAQWNGSISETVRNMTHVHIHFFFCSEWRIVWPHRILTFLGRPI